MLVSFSNVAGSAAVQANRVYGPTGTVPYKTGTFSTNKDFTGLYHDTTTQLDYYGARYYDAKVGLFLSADSVQGNLQGMNPYAYVGGNPETMNDPTGNMYAPPPDDGESQSHAQQDAYNYVTSNQLGSSGLPTELEAYLYDHATWEQAEIYANYHLHSTIRLLLTEAAADIVHIKGINWNANNQMRHLFLVINGLTMTETMAIAGLGIEGPMSTIDDVAHVVAESRDPLESDTHMSVDDKGNITVSGDEQTSGDEDDGGPCSFTPQTPVETNHGEQAIGTLKVGDKVLAYNPKTHKMELEAVQHVWLSHDNDLVDLTLTTTTHAPHSSVLTKTSEVIHTNQKHSFFTVEKEFVPVAQLHLGMHVLRADGNIGVVTGWKVVSGTQVMYNLTVAQDHTFTVDAGEWVVHNNHPLMAYLSPTSCTPR